MLTNDLFNSKFERELQEGAVDDLRRRMIDNLSSDIVELKGELRSARTAEDVARINKKIDALMKKREDIVFDRPPQVEEWSNSAPGHDASQRTLSRVPFKKGLVQEKGIPGNLPPDQVPGKEDLLKGKGRKYYEEGGIPGNLPPDQVPGKEDLLKGRGRKYYEDMDETTVAPPTAQERAFQNGVGVFEEIKKVWEEKKPFANIPMPDGGRLTLTRNQVFNILIAVKNMTPQEYKKLMPTIFTNVDRFMLWVPTIMKYQIPKEAPPEAPAGIAPGGQVMTQQPLIKEAKAQKKNSKDDEDLTPQSVRDPVVQRELQKAQGRVSSAKSPIEALIRDEINAQQRIEQELEQQKSDVQLQDKKIADLQKQLATAMQTIKTAPVAPTTAATPTATATPAEKPATAKPSAISVPTTAKAEPEKEPAKTADAETQRQIQDLQNELLMTKLKMQEPGVSRAEHDSLKQELNDIRSQIEKMNQKAKSLSKARDNAKNMGDVVPADMPEPIALPDKELKILSQKDLDDLYNQEKVASTVDESHMSELDAMRQDLERMNDRQFYTAYGISKAAFQQKYRTLLNPAQQQSVPVKETDDDDWEEDEGDYVNDPAVHAQVRKPTLPDAVLKRIQQNPSMRADIIAAYKRQAGIAEGWSDAIVSQRTGRPRTPYSVYIKGKKWKDFENEDHAENVANKLRAKFKAEGRDPTVITIAPTDYDKGMDEAQQPGHKPGWALDPKTKLELKRRKQSRELPAKFGGKIIPKDVEEAANPAQQAAIAVNMKKHHKKPKHMDEAPGAETLAHNQSTVYSNEKAMGLAEHGGGVNGLKNYVAWRKKANRERGVTKGYPPVGRPAKSGHSVAQGSVHSKLNTAKGVIPSTANEGSMAQAAHRPDGPKFGGYWKGTDKNPPRPGQGFGGMEENVNENQDTSGVESAILRRIMVQHKDWLLKFGPQKVMQAAEEVAYNVGDADEIGTSDISAWVHQVGQILGAIAE